MFRVLVPAGVDLKDVFTAQHIRDQRTLIGTGGDNDVISRDHTV
jgi:hypothetical protein